MPIAASIKVEDEMTDPVVKVTVSVAEWIQSTKEERDDLMERLNGYAEGQAQVVWELAP